MTAVIITKKNLNRLAKSLLKEVYDFLHDEYILSTFEEMKKEQKRFLKNLDLNFISNLDFVKDEINTERIYEVMSKLKLDKEIDEDLYFKKKAFLDIFNIFDTDYIYLDE